MGYDLFISKNKFIPVESVKGIEFHPKTKEVLVKETIWNFWGWDIAELFDSEHPTGQISRDDLIEFYKKYCKLKNIPESEYTLERITSDEDCFFSYDESY